MTQQIAQLNNLRIAPRKVRLLANLLKNLSAQEAEAQLLFRNKRSAKPLLKLLRSAMANAKNNKKIDPARLFVKSVLVNQGTMLKRFMPRAMGRATPIHKKMSHVTLVLEETAKLPLKRFTINPPVKKEKKQKTKTSRAKMAEKATEKPKEKVGFFKRIFRRKSI